MFGFRVGRLTGEVTLTLTSLMDIFTILVIFFLKSFSVQPESNVTLSDKLKLPVSTSEKTIKQAVNLVISKDMIVVEGKPVMRVIEWEPEGTRREELMIEPLYTALKKESDKIKYIATFNEAVEFKGEINLIADKDIPFSLLKKILYTAGQAEFGEFKFTAMKEGD